MKAWKKKEVELTEWLTATGLWNAERKSRAWRGEAVEDIRWGPMSVELKTRKAIPQYLFDWLNQAATNALGRVPIVIVHQDRTRIGQQLVVMTLDFFVRLLGEVGGGKDSQEHDRA